MKDQNTSEQLKDEARSGALHRMAGRRRAEAEQAQAAFLAALRLAFGRMGADCPGLDAVVQGASLREGALAEVLDLAEPGMFLALVEGPAERMGLVMASPAVLAGIIEAQTTGRVEESAVHPRKPTRTDAALLAPMIEAFLQQVAQCCAGQSREKQVKGFVYGSFQDDPRPLGLMLEDGQYTIIKLSVALGFGAKSGEWFLILPQVEPEPESVADDDTPSADESEWQARLDHAVGTSPIVLDAVLCRLQISITDALRLRVGDTLRVPESALESLGLETLEHDAICEGRLGQARGQRAVRLTKDVGTPAALPAPTSLPAAVLPLKPQQPAFDPTKVQGQTGEAPEHAQDLSVTAGQADIALDGSDTE